MFQKKEVNNGKVFKTNDLEIEDWLPEFYCRKYKIRSEKDV